MALSKIHLGRMAEDSSVTSAKITDGTLVNADFNACAAITASKAAVGTSTEIAAATMNVALLGFKMAVTESLTVFNLVDGIVDEFHDESGTDEGEGSNDLYCSSNDLYINSTVPTGSPVSVSAGFTLTAVTEADTSTAGTNPGNGVGTTGEFTVPAGLTSLNMQV